MGSQTVTDLTRSGGLPPLTMTADWPQPDVCVVHLAGELDMATTPVLADYLREQTAGNPAHLVIDLSAVRLLAAAGVALIVSVLHDQEDVHRRLHVIGVTDNRPVRHVLTITGVGDLLSVYANVTDILDDIARG